MEYERTSRWGLSPVPVVPALTVIGQEIDLLITMDDLHFISFAGISCVCAMPPNAAVPLVEVCRRLEQPGLPGIDAGMLPLFRDVSDHIRRVPEELESLREVLAFAFESSLMTGQSQQNEITRKLGAWAAILAVQTAVAGVYGMNFEYMPELEWEYGYALVLALIAAVCGGLYWRFRRNHWL